jgi:hypothetical protein
MNTSRQPSPYETLTAMRPRLLKRSADMGAVSLLGQAVSDVLDDDASESVLLDLIADLESARSSTTDETINERWNLPLTALLGLLRQRLHNRTVQAASFNPTSATLRDKVLAAIDAGVDTPTAIGEYVHSPTTVVSRVLRQLTDEGRVSRAEQGEDRRRRPYERVLTEPSPALVLESSVPSSTPRRMADVGALIDIAEALTQCNAQMAAVFLPDLIAAGSNAHLSPSVRVSALGVAAAIVRWSGAANAAEDALDLADTAEMIAKGSRENLVRARAAYESARAGFFALPNDSDAYLADLERAERFAERETGSESQLRLGWCAYTRCLIDEGTDLRRADEHAQKALHLFEANDFSYGMAAALTAQTRVRYTISEREGTARLAFRALSIANSHGYLRIMAESAFWAGELLSDEDPDQADRLFTSAAEHFQAVGNSQWSALAYASRALTREQRRVRELDVGQAERLLAELRDLESNLPSNDMSWAAAVLKRRIAALARRAQKYAVAEREFGKSLEIYEAAASAPGLAMARAGLLATEREHAEVRKDDVVDALRGSGSPFVSGFIPDAAVSAVEPLEYESSYELGSI